MSADIHVVEHQAVDTAVVRETVPIAELPGFFSRAFGATMRVLTAQGVHPIGPPFGEYHGMPGAVVDVEAGFPVQRPIQASGEVSPGSLPAGMIVEALHVGSYTSIGQAYAEIEQFIAGHDLIPGAIMWESYLSDPSVDRDSSQWRTLVQWPVTARGAAEAEPANPGAAPES